MGRTAPGKWHGAPGWGLFHSTLARGGGQARGHAGAQAGGGPRCRRPAALPRPSNTAAGASGAAANARRPTYGTSTSGPAVRRDSSSACAAAASASGKTRPGSGRSTPSANASNSDAAMASSASRPAA